MKKHLKLLVLVLTLVLVIGAVAIVSSAADDNYVCQVGTTKYTSLHEALRAMSSGQTITLTKDVTLNETIGGYSADGKSEKKSYKINLNGHTLTTNVANAIQNHYGYDIRIIGEGELVVNVSSFFNNYSGSQIGKLAVVGSGKGIKITAPNGSLISAGRSQVTFENVYFDIKNGADGSQTPFVLSNNEASITLNNCYVSTWKYANHNFDSVFFVGNGTTPTINIKNSYIEYGPRFYGLGTGNVPSGAKLNIENSFVTQKFNSNFVGDAQKIQAIYTPTGSFEINIKASTFEYAYRFIEVNKDGENFATVNVTDNSTITHIGRPYNLGTYNNELVRFGVVKFDSTSKYITPVSIGVTHTSTGADGYVQLAEGTRVSATNPFKHSTAYVLFPDGSTTLNSTTYTFAFDPITDTTCPYVVVKVGEEPATNKVSGGSYQFDNFQGMHSDSNEGYLYHDADSKAYRGGDYGLLASPYNMGGGAMTGTMMLVDLEGNTAVKYWANPTEEYPVGTMRPVTKTATDANKACLFVGAGAAIDSTALAVYSVDIATDTDYFANVIFRLSVDMQQSPTPNLFRLNADGSITDTGNLKQSKIISDTMVPLTKLAKGEWYRVTAIVDIENDEIHVYLNGVYSGSVSAVYPREYTKSDGKAATTATINGFRIDIASNTMLADSALLMDNASLATFATIPEGVNYKDLILNVKENDSFAKNDYVVAGKAYSDVNEAIEAAVSKNLAVYLVNDVTAPTTVTKDGTLVTAGYTMNVSTASLGYKNVNGTYIFDSRYHVKYLFQTGVDANGEFVYTEAAIGVNVVPAAPAGSIADKAYKKNEATGTYLVASLLGWSEDPTSTTPDNLGPVTMEDVEKYDGDAIYLYPVYGTYSETGYLYVVIDTATGTFKRGGNHNSLWGSRIASDIALMPGETLVLCSSDISWADGFSHQDSTICSGKVQGEVGIDLNGYTMAINGSANDLRKVSAFFIVKEGITLNVYSSRANAKITTVGINDVGINSKNSWNGTNPVPANAYTKGASGGSLFILRPTTTYTHEANSGETNMNAHLNIGTYNGKYAGNLSIEATNLVYAESGDKTCSITVDGLDLTRNAADYAGLIYTKYYYGDLTVKNCNIYGAAHNSIIAAEATTASTVTDEETGTKTFVSPDCTVVIDNCTILVRDNGANIINSTQAFGTVTITNVVTNGSIKASDLKSNVIVGENVCAYALAPSGYVDGIIPAAYNLPMTVENGSISTNYIYLDKTEAGTIKQKGDIQYLVHAFLSYGSEAAENATVLPLLAYKTVKAEDAVKVTFKGIGTNADVVVDYAKGGNVAAIALDDATLNAFKLVFTGFEGTLPTNVQQDVTVTPTYEVKSNIEGVKVNLSIYSDFVINLYVPVAYEDYIASITDGTDTLTTSKVTLEDGEYIKVVIKRASNEATLDAVFTINLAEGEYTKAVNVTVSIASYAEAILKGEGYTAEDKQLMYYMLTYANEAYKYFGDKENYDAAITALLTTYADAKGEGMAEQTYAKAIENLAFGTVITEATVNLGAAPAFVFTVAEGFDGTITVTYAGNTKELVVKDGKAIVNGMKVYNFGADVTVTAVGTVNGEAVNETATYNLDTFVKYHVDNAKSESETAEASKACVALLKALYDYVTCADLYTK